MRSMILAGSACLCIPLAVQAASVVTLTPASGHPGLPVTVAGTGFGVSEAVDVYIDTVDTALLVSGSTGAFSGTVTMPATEGPGAHTITAIGRKSGDAAQSPFTVATNWAQQGFGLAHYAWNPYENTVSTANVSSLGLLWSVANVAAGGTPAVAGGRAIVGLFSGVQALVPATGAVSWTSQAGQIFDASPAVVGGVVYEASLTGNVYALQASTGAVTWSRALGGSIYGSPAVAKNIVYVGNYSTGVFYALDATTGATKWTYTTGGGIDGSASVVAGVVYFGSTDQKVYALNAATGALIWSFTTDGLVESTPAVANDVVYIGSDDGMVYAIRAAGSPGVLLWSYATGGAVYSAPALAYGMVFAGASDGGLNALDARTGALRWRVPTGGLVRSPVVANGVVYATSQDGLLYAVAASYGGVLASAATGSDFIGSPSIADGTLYIAASGGNTQAFALLAGTNAVPAGSRPPSPASLRPDMRLTVSR